MFIKDLTQSLNSRLANTATNYIRHKLALEQATGCLCLHFYTLTEVVGSKESIDIEAQEHILDIKFQMGEMSYEIFE